MIQKKNLLLLALILLFVQVSAQRNISGSLLDAANRKPLASVTVRLLERDLAMVQSAISDSLGCFVFRNLSPGSYRLQYSMTGYVSRLSTVIDAAGNSPVHLPPVLLSSDTQLLAGVVVTGRRSLITSSIDGFVYNASREVHSGGETAADLLRKLPAMQVDPDGTPSIQGSSRIKVFIDNKPSALLANSVADALRQVAADQIETIEVITHPPARYDGEGTDGIINIFTKKQKEEGVSGALNGFLANRRNQLSGNLTWKKGGWVTGADLGHDADNMVTLYKLERAADATPTGQQLALQKTVNNRGRNFYGGVNLSYLPDSLNTFNAGYRYGGNRFKEMTSIDYHTENRTFTRVLDNPSTRPIHAVNWSWLGKSKDRSSEYSIMGYWFLQSRRSHYLLDQYHEGLREYSELNDNNFYNRELSLQADYVKKYEEVHLLETGIKAAFRKFSNENIFNILDMNKAEYLPDTVRTDRFWFNWAIWAAYASYTLNLHSWKVKLGGRYEQTHWPLHFRDTTLTIPDYRNFLPNIIIAKTISSHHRLSAGYARKLIRPYINYLNPVINYADPMNLEYGNPSLKPAIKNNYDLTYTFQNTPWLISVAFFMNQTVRSIERVRIIQSDSVAATTYANISSYTTAGLSASASLRLRRFSVSLNHTSRYLVFDPEDGHTKRSGLIVNQIIDVSFKPWKSFTVQAYTRISSREITFQGYTTPIQSYSLSANKELLAGKLNISLRMDNFFTPYWYVSELAATNHFQQQTETRSISRFFRVGVTWKLGKKEIKRPEVSSADSGD